MTKPAAKIPAVLVIGLQPELLAGQSMPPENWLDRCQAVTGHEFKNADIIRQALTHSSVAETRAVSNERLEFLGDAVLGLVVCEYLFANYPTYLEGDLTKVKSAVVSRKCCAEVAQLMGLHKLLNLGKGMTTANGMPESLAAAVFESVIAAIYLDGGFEAARNFILANMTSSIQRCVASEHQQNYKSKLQQHAQKDLVATPTYELLDEKGPDHSKCFEVAVNVGGRRFGSAWGNSKKEAEQRAAYNALIALKLLDPAVELPPAGRLDT